MANINDIYGSSGSLLSVAVVEEEELDDMDLTITSTEVSEFPDNFDNKDSDKKISKVVLSFEETEKELALNKTNAKIMAEAFGDDTDDWDNKVIQLIIITTSNGKPGIQVRVPRKRKPKAKAKAKKAPNFERLAKKNEAIADAMTNVRVNEDEMTLDNIVGELKGMKLDGDITQEEFEKAGILLGFE